MFLFYLKVHLNKTDKKTTPKSAVDISMKRIKELLGNSNKLFRFRNEYDHTETSCLHSEGVALGSVSIIA